MILVQPIGAAVAAPTPPAQRPAARLQRDGVTRSASPGAPSIGTPWPATMPSGASLSFRCCASVSTGSLLSVLICLLAYKLLKRKGAFGGKAA